MEIELKTRWLEALRSGRYLQGKGALRTANNQHCCIGVLCDLIDPSAWDAPRTEEREVYAWKGQTGNIHAISHEMGAEVYCQHLPELNDFGATFEQIAQIIDSGDVVQGVAALKLQMARNRVEPENS